MQPNILIVLYIFSGEKRKSDIDEWLRHFARLNLFCLDLVERDLQVGGADHDVLNSFVWDEILKVASRAQ
eukprot:12129890-Karenia_brevis.AAC.1